MQLHKEQQEENKLLWTAVEPISSDSTAAQDP